VVQRDAATVVAARKFADLTQVELAGKMGVSLSTVSRLEKADPRVEPDNWARAAQALGLIYDWQTGRITPNKNIPPGAIDRAEREIEEAKKKKANGHSIPAGIDGTLINADPIPTWDLDVAASAWVDVPVCRLDADDPAQARVIKTGRFRLRILGHCMEPHYQSGMTVEFQIVRIEEEGLVVNKDYVVCRNDGTATFKRLVRVNEDDISLAATNQKEYGGVLVVPRQEISRVARVVGRILPPPPEEGVKIAGTKNG
jgi:transcriptional regulator with XRE-family HTH domain